MPLLWNAATAILPVLNHPSSEPQLAQRHRKSTSFHLCTELLSHSHRVALYPMQVCWFFVFFLFFPVWKSKTRKLRVESGSSSRVERTHKKSDHIFKMKIEERSGIQKDHKERMQGWYLAKTQSITQWVASVNLMRPSCLQLTKDCIQNEKENPKFPSPHFCLLP